MFEILLFFFKVIELIFGHAFLDFTLLLLYIFLNEFILFENLFFVVVDVGFILGSKFAEFSAV